MALEDILSRIKEETDREIDTIIGEARAEKEKRLKEAQEKKDYSEIFLYREKLWLYEIYRKGGIHTDIWFLFMDDLVLIFLPLDTFYEIEKRLNACCFKKLCIIGITNGHQGYIEDSSMTVKSRKSPMSWSLLSPEAGDRLISHVLEVLNHET